MLYTVSIDFSGQVHFIGWSTTWDMCFKRTSQDVQKLHTFTTNWRQVRWPCAAELTVVMVVQVVVVVAVVRWWCW